MKDGGEKGIRTLETVTRLHTFQACAFDHSAISPCHGRRGPVRSGRTILIEAFAARPITRPQNAFVTRLHKPVSAVERRTALPIFAKAGQRATTSPSAIPRI